ncbi:MAG: aldehyde dehydrogenase family protein, partial [Bdellovibrionales bacterium]|nr:aldehyde dehydrogenase family protein [Bdellovibrionales bacterium]
MTQSISVSNPFDGSFIQDVPLVAESKIETALEKSFTLFSNRKSWIPPYERIAILERLAVLLDRNKERLIALAITEGGKPYRDTFIEVERAISGVSLGVQAIHELHGKEIPMGLTKASQGFLGTSFREPRGVVVSFSAFNHPINLVIHQTVPAIAAGAPVIIKPSPATPLSCFEVVKLIHEAGLPEHWCQTFLCSNESAEKMVCDHRISYLSFIGSSTVGWQLRSLLAPGARCALEHGGVAPVLIHDDVELETIIPNLLKGAFYHAGQVCISAQKVFIPKAIFSKFCDSLLKHIATLKVGDPTEESTDVGPLIKISE